MDHVFGKYRLATPLTTSLNPIYPARSSLETTWNFVVKVYAAYLLHTPEEEEAFRREMATRMQLQHPFLLPFLDYGIEKGIPYAVTTYQAGGSLRDRINQALPSRLAPQKAMHIIAQVGQALHYAHEHHIVHGNIKPENILFDEHDDALLSDFSLFQERELPNAQSRYYPPAEPLSEKSDQYALGRLAYELFIGQATADLLIEDAALSGNTGADQTLSFHVEEVLLKAMASTRDARYETIAAFLEALDDVYTSYIATTLSHAAISDTSWPIVDLSRTASVQRLPALLPKKIQPRRRRILLSQPAQAALILGTLSLVIGVLLLFPFTHSSLPRTTTLPSSQRVSRVSATATVTAPMTTLVLSPLPITATTSINANSATPTASVWNTSSYVTSTSTVVNSISTAKVVVGDTSSNPTSSSGSSHQSAPTPTPFPTATPSPTPSPWPTPSPTATPSPTPSPTPTSGCHITYSESDWNVSGFIVSIVITNTSRTSLSSWRLQWTFSGNQRITQVWNANVFQQGQNVTLTNAPWNGMIGAGRSISGVGFLGTYSGTMVNPSNFVLNGVACR